MAYEITATRKRPHSFEELAGQDFVSATLRASIASGRIAHAYLFAGPRGCGKTSTARILARSLNCERGPTADPCGVCDSCKAITRGAAIDVIEIDGASNTSVENIRQIKDEVLFPPNSSKYKIYIIDEVHMLSNSAFNALLKTIEEPPPYIVFMFATTELHKVPATIKSRCQQFNFRLIPLEVLVERLRSAASDLSIQADDDALLWMAREATGSMRDAYTLFDQVASFSEGHITAAKIRDKLGLVGQERMSTLLGLCFAGCKAEAVELLSAILSGGVSVEQFVTDAVSYVRSLLLISCGVERESLLGAARRSFPANLTALDAARLERILALLFDLHRNLRFSVNPAFELELFVIRVCSINEYISPGQLARTVQGLRTMLVQGSGAGQAELAALADGLPAALKIQGSPAPVRDAGLRVETATEPQLVPPPPAAVSQSDSAPQSAGFPAAREPARPEASADSLLAGDEPGTDQRQTSAEPGQDAQWLRDKLLGLLAKRKLVLSASLERSCDWQLVEDRLVLKCANAYDGNTILAESNLLAKRVSELLGRVIRLDIKVPEHSAPAPVASRNHDDDEDEDYQFEDGETAVPVEQPAADSATIVERVFRGKRLDTAEPAAKT